MLIRAALPAELANLRLLNPIDTLRHRLLALSRPFADLAARLSGAAMPQGFANCTVELRGRAEVTRDLGLQDARAIIGYLAHPGVMSDTPPCPLPGARGPLAGSEALVPPLAGLSSHAAAPGATVADGDPVARITNPLTGTFTPVRAGTTGVFHARLATRIAKARKRL